jgi:hypothetical protein
MSVVYGVITYIMIVLLVVGYFVVKWWGDKDVQPGLLEEEGLNERLEGGDE